jgi:hypothetical protein
VSVYIGSLCDGCSGRGMIEVKNAYDPKSVDLELCELCGGTGIAEDDTPSKFQRTKKRNPQDFEELD